MKTELEITLCEVVETVFMFLNIVLPLPKQIVPLDYGWNVWLEIAIYLKDNVGIESIGWHDERRKKLYVVVGRERVDKGAFACKPLESDYKFQIGNIIAICASDVTQAAQPQIAPRWCLVIGPDSRSDLATQLLMPKMAPKAISRRKKPQNVNSDTADELSDSDDGTTGIENIEVGAPTHSKI
jgi:hypothetical protein